MKSVSVSDLRNKFIAVSRWIDKGHTVEITKRGKPFAFLMPLTGMARLSVCPGGTHENSTGFQAWVQHKKIPQVPKGPQKSDHCSKYEPVSIESPRKKTLLGATPSTEPLPKDIDEPIFWESSAQTPVRSLQTKSGGGPPHSKTLRKRRKAK